MPSMKHLYHYILEVQTFIGGEVVQTSMFQITFGMLWYASDNYLIELTIDSQVVVGYWFFTFYNAHSKAHVICIAVASLIGLAYRNNMN
jgi:hypothetical protein